VARAPLTAAEQQQQAKLKREQMNDAFHGRLAGIKQNVDALNDRLTSFEDKVHKEDAHLIKGNPEAFDIDLD
jgi:archaellum component FlaC